MALLQVNDWNFCDKWYRVPLPVLKEFKNKLQTQPISNAWEWFTKQVKYPDHAESANNPVEYLTTLVIAEMDEAFFLDFNDPIESSSDWGDDELDEA